MEILLEQNIWDGRKPVKISFPEEWDVTCLDIPADKEPVLDKEKIREKLEHPYGMMPLSKLAKGKKKVGIAFDDGSRGTPCGVIAEVVLEILFEAGVKKEDIFFICAPGSHGTFGRKLFADKLGEKIVSEYLVLNHDCHENCTKVGTWNGIDIKVNNEFLSCDLRIGIGGVFPHAMSGFSGGNRLLIPGLCHLDTIEGIHNIVNEHMASTEDLSVLNGHKENMMMHEMITEIAKLVGDFFKIDCVCNSKLELVGLYSGNAFEEYCEAATFAEKMMQMEKYDGKADVVIANNNAKTSYAAGGLVAGLPYIEKDGILVLVNHTSDGQIPHYLRGYWGACSPPRIPVEGGLNLPCKVIYFSKYGDYNARKDMHLEHADYVWARTWDEVLAIITAEKKNPRVCVLKEASMGIT